MKKVLTVALLASMMGLVGCGVNTSSNIDFNANSIGYGIDTRTGLCYAYVASRKTASPDTTGLGMTHVPCTDEVKRLANK